jgi:15-cis-phytoene synthase
MTDKEIFHKGSTTYYWSSKLFKPSVREDVFKLYSFVRVADDYVDSIPPDIKQYTELIGLWDKHKAGGIPALVIDTNETNARVVQNIVEVVNKYGIDPSTVDSFLMSMQMDLDKKTYQSMADSIDYMYGSAEVIGLMMSKIIGVPDKAMKYAQLQGRAMQYINFIRDIAEDNDLGRIYFPVTELKKYGFLGLSKQEAMDNLGEFKKFMNAQLDIYDEWQAEANKGFKYLPRRSRVAVRTAVDMYNWTAKQIRKNPAVVFEQKIKPSKLRVILCGLKRGVYC